MESALLLKGLIIGLSIAAPVGPIGVLCIKRTLAEGRVYGFISGLGAATADGIYGCIAGFSLAVIANFLIAQQIWLHLIGGLFLCYLGLVTFQSNPALEELKASKKGLLGAYTSTLFLTLTNPLTILSFTAIFAGLGLGSTTNTYNSAGLLVLGVFTGSALWWLALSSGVSIFRKKFDYSALVWVNKISGLIIGGFGLLALISLI